MPRAPQCYEVVQFSGPPSPTAPAPPTAPASQLGGGCANGVNLFSNSVPSVCLRPFGGAAVAGTRVYFSDQCSAADEGARWILTAGDESDTYFMRSALDTNLCFGVAAGQTLTNNPKVYPTLEPCDGGGGELARAQLRFPWTDGTGSHGTVRAEPSRRTPLVTGAVEGPPPPPYPFPTGVHTV